MALTIVIALITLVLGFLARASNSEADQIGSKYAIAYAIIIFVSAFLPSETWARYVRLILVAPPLLFLAYCAVR